LTDTPGSSVMRWTLDQFWIISHAMISDERTLSRGTAVCLARIGELLVNPYG